MILDPADCVGGNLAFIPHLYDRWERAAIAKYLPAGGVFVDVGSNVGAYALWAARHAGKTGTVIAIEAEPENYRTLVENVRLNGFADRVIALEAGVSDQESILTLSCNRTGNRGAHSFTRVSPAGVPVRCSTLDRFLEEARIHHVDMMKMDIEGFELRVLSAFFQRVPPASPLRPRFLLVEIDGGPAPEGEKQTLVRLLLDEGYRVLRKGSNWLFERR